MRSALIACCFVVIASCGESKPQHVPPKKPNNELIVGEFERRKSDGETAIRFTGDGRLRIAKNKSQLDVEPPEATGTYALEGDQLKLHYESGQCDKGSEKDAVYTVVISRVGIHFKKVSDGCQRRAAIDNQTWWRIK